MIDPNKVIYTKSSTGSNGVGYTFDYYDPDSFDHLDRAHCKQTYGVCFVGDEIAIGFGGLKKG